jgi:predicted RNase H-like nuclease
MKTGAASLHIAGIDLAWGERNPDGVCVLEVSRRRARVVATALTRGDAELLGFLATHLGDGPAFLAMDAPVVCHNRTGARPVDRLCHVHFGKFKAGAYPANLRVCARPVRITQSLTKKGFVPGWDWQGPRTLAEVYPHPAMVRLFGLEERIPYKRGSGPARRAAFRRLQRLLQACLARDFPRLELDAGTAALLRQPWTKDVEDQTDGFFCALIGYWHWLHRGRRTQVLGERETGFILVPEPGGNG